MAKIQRKRCVLVCFWAFFEKSTLANMPLSPPASPVLRMAVCPSGATPHSACAPWRRAPRHRASVPRVWSLLCREIGSCDPDRSDSDWIGSSFQFILNNPCRVFWTLLVPLSSRCPLSRYKIWLGLATGCKRLLAEPERVRQKGARVLQTSPSILEPRGRHSENLGEGEQGKTS